MVRQLLLVLSVLLLTSALHADDAQKKQKKQIDAAVERGLEYLKNSQYPDGHWDAPGGVHPTTMTSMAGMAMLMEGSTLREGKYAPNLLKAVEWMMMTQMPNGTLTRQNHHTSHEHGFGMLFLASVYGEDIDKETRAKLEAVLKKAVKVAGDGQSKAGGWFYNLGDAQDEGSTTITILQGLRAARNAGIPVPKEIIDRATKYLKDCTAPSGAIYYSYHSRNECVAITAASIASAFSSGNYEDEHAKRWINYCHDHVPMQRGQHGWDEYMHYYYAQACFMMGEESYGKLFPGKDRSTWTTWSHYKSKTFSYILTTQRADGSWISPQAHGGVVFSTGISLCILQLEKNILPIYFR